MMPAPNQPATHIERVVVNYAPGITRYLDSIGMRWEAMAWNGVAKEITIFVPMPNPGAGIMATSKIFWATKHVADGYHQWRQANGH